MENKDFYIEDLITNQRQSKLKRHLKIIFGLIVIVIFIIIIIIIISIASDKKSDELPDVYTVFKLNTFFFFDPISNKRCNEKNYWTPFDQSTTCFRFVSITDNDTDKNNTIRIMLDHNIGMSNFSDYKNILKQKTSNWTRYKGEIDIIDEPTIFRLMKYLDKPTKNASVTPKIRLHILPLIHFIEIKIYMYMKMDIGQILFMM